MKRVVAIGKYGPAFTKNKGAQDESRGEYLVEKSLLDPTPVPKEKKP